MGVGKVITRYCIFRSLLNHGRESAELLPPWTSRGQTLASFGPWFRGSLRRQFWSAQEPRKAGNAFKGVILKVQELTITKSRKTS